MTGPMVTWVPGKELLHSLGQHVSAIVADQLERGRVVAGDDGQ
jgi:hypothetical protein